METLLESVRAALTSTDPATRRAGWLAAQQLAASLDSDATMPAPGGPNPNVGEAPQREPRSHKGLRPDAATYGSAARTTGHAAPSVGDGDAASAALNGTPEAPIDPALIAQVLSSLRSLPPEQLLDLAISRLRAALPAHATATNAPPMLRFQLVPLHGLGPRK